MYDHITDHAKLGQERGESTIALFQAQLGWGRPGNKAKITLEPSSSGDIALFGHLLQS